MNHHQREYRGEGGRGSWKSLPFHHTYTNDTRQSDTLTKWGLRYEILVYWNPFNEMKENKVQGLTFYSGSHKKWSIPITLMIYFSPYTLHIGSLTPIDKNHDNSNSGDGKLTGFGLWVSCPPEQVGDHFYSSLQSVELSQSI